jgi:DNA-binding MarR family transcriptional regulator
VSVLIVDGDQSVTLSNFSLAQLGRIQMEHKILSCFYDRRKLTVKDIEERSGLPFSSIRNHLYRMVENGSLKLIKKRVANYNLSYYEVNCGS